MSINWFTVIAQIVNFLILVWLLKRYLYKPILKAIDDREKKITSKIEDANKKEADAKKEREEFEKKNTDFDKQKKELMNKAVEEVNTKREDLLEKAKKDAGDLRKKLEDIVKEEQGHLADEITRRTKTEVFSIAKKMLKELADSNLEEKIVTVFIGRLKNLDDDEKKKLIDTFKGAKEDIIVKSVFELDKPQQTEIEKVVKKILHTTSDFKFQTAPELVSGIELNANGYKVAWSISEYLLSVNKTIEELIDSKSKVSSVHKKEHKHAKA
ncbi:MAG: F0F1 ATP synthase subunit B [Bacteroidia bacterium]